ncbi:MAG: signal transduction histidine kinase [Arcticibacterium sp.]|jgi:signal transduction histidine kinase
MSLKIKDRLALNYLVATSLLMAAVFSIIYFVVEEVVMFNIDRDLSFELNKHTEEVLITGDELRFVNMAEWEEREHLEVQVNPVFIQIVNVDGKIMGRSPNLKNYSLHFIGQNNSEFYDQKIGNQRVRTAQIALEEKGQISGYILAAMSLESSLIVLQKLFDILLISYGVVVLVIFCFSRILSGRLVRPIKHLSESMDDINRNSLSERVLLPANQDEIYSLSLNFNRLLDRNEEALIRERQFTADASHQLRTPLSVLKGTLEVLIRRERKRTEYEDKINFCINEIDRMGKSAEQLLTIARMDNHQATGMEKRLKLKTIIDAIIQRFDPIIQQQNLKVNFHSTVKKNYWTEAYYSDLILENLISNALKYSPKNAEIHILLDEDENGLCCAIKDSGIGIRPEDLERIFNSFYRSNAPEHLQVKGNGLGLAIARKAADSFGARLEVKSDFGKGSCFSLYFPRSILSHS